MSTPLPPGEGAGGEVTPKCGIVRGSKSGHAIAGATARQRRKPPEKGHGVSVLVTRGTGEVDHERAIVAGYSALAWGVLTIIAFVTTGAWGGRFRPVFGSPEIYLGTIPWAMLIGRALARRRAPIRARLRRWLRPPILLRLLIGVCLLLFAIAFTLSGTFQGDPVSMFIGFGALTVSGGCLSSAARRVMHRRHRRRRRVWVWP